jgi:hypothetical protein
MVYGLSMNDVVVWSTGLAVEGKERNMSTSRFGQGGYFRTTLPSLFPLETSTALVALS